MVPVSKEEPEKEEEYRVPVGGEVCYEIILTHRKNFKNFALQILTGVICKLTPNCMKLFDNMFHVFHGYLFILSPRFKNFGSSRISLNPTLRPNSDDSLCHVIDSCKIFGLKYEVRPNENKTDLGWF